MAQVGVSRGTGPATAHAEGDRRPSSDRFAPTFSHREKGREGEEKARCAALHPDDSATWAACKQAWTDGVAAEAVEVAEFKYLWTLSALPYILRVFILGGAYGLGC